MQAQHLHGNETAVAALAAAPDHASDALAVPSLGSIRVFRRGRFRGSIGGDEGGARHYDTQAL